MPNKNLEILKRDGWLLVKNFFDEAFCDNLRAACYSSVETGSNTSDLLSDPYLNHLFLNERLIKLVTELLGGEMPVYFSDATFQIASVEGVIRMGFHKDSLDRENSKGADWTGDDYSIIRVGIYLQDHKHFSEGLMVRTKSHKIPDSNTGKKVNVPSEKGDLVIWYLTTTHSGNAKRIKGTDAALLMRDTYNDNPISNLYYKIINKLVQPSQKDRVALFLTFGKNDLHLSRYLKYLKHRDYMVSIWKNTNYDNNLLQKIKDQNLLEVRDMKNEVESINDSNFVEYDFTNFEKFNI